MLLRWSLICRWRRGRGEAAYAAEATQTFHVLLDAIPEGALDYPQDLVVVSLGQALGQLVLDAAGVYPVELACLVHAYDANHVLLAPAKVLLAVTLVQGLEVLVTLGGTQVEFVENASLGSRLFARRCASIYHTTLMEGFWTKLRTWGGKEVRAAEW